MPDSRTHHLATCETHPEIPASQVVEGRILDPLSARRDEYTATLYILICASPACEVSAKAAVRMDGADERTICTYPATPDQVDAILGAVA